MVASLHCLGEGEVDATDHSVDRLALPVLDAALELLDPTVDLGALFLQLDALFFWPARCRAGALEPTHDAECRAMPLPDISQLALLHPAQHTPAPVAAAA